MSNTQLYDGLAIETDEDFKTPDYVPGAVKQLACAKCGGLDFRIGVTEMFLTLACCVKCAVPFTVHQG